MQLIKIKQIDGGELSDFVSNIVEAESSLVTQFYSLPTGIYSTGVSFGSVLSGIPMVICSVSVPPGAPLLYANISGQATLSGVNILLSNWAAQTGYYLNIIASF